MIQKIFFSFLLLSSIFLFSRCSQQVKQDTQKINFGGFESQVKWGEHLVLIIGCNHCHTPQIKTPNGYEPDMSLFLSGHPSKKSPPDIDRKEIESKDLIVNNRTSWIGTWGISYAANITSDPTGIGNWQESNFITALKEGKYKGIMGARSLLSPMPWKDYKNLTEDELKAIFAFLKSTKPIQNIVPEYQPPVSK
jgi:hypothetical protein